MYKYSVGVFIVIIFELLDPTLTRTRSRSDDRPTLPGPAPLPVSGGAQPQWNTSSGGHSPVEVYEHKPNDPMQPLGTAGTCICVHVYDPWGLIVYIISTLYVHTCMIVSHMVQLD